MEVDLASGYATVLAEDDLSLAGSGPAAFAGRPLALALAFGRAAGSADAFRTAPAPPAGGGGGPAPDTTSIEAGTGLVDRLLLRGAATLVGISASLIGMPGGLAIPEFQGVPPLGAASSLGRPLGLPVGGRGFLTLRARTLDAGAGDSSLPMS